MSKKKLNKSDLRDLLVVSKGITPEEAKSVLETLLNAIKTNLRRGVSIGLEGICTIEPKIVEAHIKKGFGVEYNVAEHKKLIIKESKNLFPKASVKKTDASNDVIDNFADTLKNFDLSDD